MTGLVNNENELMMVPKIVAISSTLTPTIYQPGKTPRECAVAVEGAVFMSDVLHEAVRRTTAWRFSDGTDVSWTIASILGCRTPDDGGHHPPRPFGHTHLVEGSRHPGRRPCACAVGYGYYGLVRPRPA